MAVNLISILMGSPTVQAARTAAPTCRHACTNACNVADLRTRYVCVTPAYKFALTIICTMNYTQPACNLSREKSPCPLLVACVCSPLSNVPEYDKGSAM